MAIIEDLGLAVSVIINGSPAIEYHDPDPLVHRDYPRSKYVSKYIEAQDDTTYVIKCEALPAQSWLTTSNDNVIACSVMIDGEWQCTKALAGPKSAQGVVSTIDGVFHRKDGNRTTLSNFKFAAINTVDDANTAKVKEDTTRAKGIGLIRVLLSRGVDLHRLVSWGAEGKVQDLSIAEKALKGRAVSHGTTYSVAREVQARGYMNIDWIDPYSKPYAVFDFHYRSRDALRSEMIIPRAISPSPAPALGNPDGFEGLSQEDIRRLARERLAEIKDERAVKRDGHVLKREFGQTIDLTGEQDENVRPERKYKVGRTEERSVDPVVIDLLDDSDEE